VQVDAFANELTKDVSSVDMETVGPFRPRQSPAAQL